MILDEIHLRQSEWMALQADYEEKYPNGGDNLRYLLHPALPFYRLRLLATQSHNEMIIDVMPPASSNLREWRVKGGGIAETQTVIKIADPTLPSVVVVALGAVRMEGNKPYSFISDNVIAAPSMLQRGMAEGLAWMSLCLIQDALINRPTIFISRKEFYRPNQSSNPREKKHTRRRVVKAYRVITLVPDGLLPSPSSEKRVIACPCWGVIGHWRVYKSGKRVWISPYEKGRDRGNASHYQSKEYKIMQEVK